MKASELRQSILQMAVQGKLVPQDLHDEPASGLLERIRAEKAKLIKEGKIKKEKPLPPITEDEIPCDLPEGWVWCRLNDLFDFVDYRGKTPNKIDAGVPLITGANIKKGYMDYSKRWFISEKEFNERKSRGVSQIGDILFTTEAPLGHVAMADLDIYSAGQRIITLQSYYTISNPMYVYFLLSPDVRQRIFDKRSGMTATGIKAALLRLILIPLPPLAEQQRIVAKVDELMAMCDDLEAAEGELEILEEHFIEYLPKSILQMAVQGKLVPQDLHDEPASELLERIRVEKAKLVKEGKIKKEKPLPPITVDEIPYDLPEGWVWCRLGDVVSLISGRDLETKQFNDAGKGIPYITGASTIDRDNILVNRWAQHPMTISQLGDLLISCKGTVGKMVFNDIGECHIARQIMAIRFINHDIVPSYIKVFLGSYVHQLVIRAKSIIPGISREDVLCAVIPLPPAAEQQRITTKIDEIMSLCSQLKLVKTEPARPVGQNILHFPPVMEQEEIGIAARGDGTTGLSAKAQQDADELFGDG